MFVSVCQTVGMGSEGAPDINKLSGQNPSHFHWICFLLQ